MSEPKLNFIDKLLILLCLAVVMYGVATTVWMAAAPVG